MTNEFGNLQIHEPYYGSDQVTIGDGASIPIQHTGKGILPTPSHKFLLSNLLHVPQLYSNLLSVHQLTKDKNCKVTFDSNSFIIQDKASNKIMYRGLNSQGLYHLPIASNYSTPACHTALVTSSTWHHRLGHPSSSKLAHWNKNFKLGCNNKDFQSLCTTCVSKSHRLPLYLSNSTSNKPLSLIHSDVWGPFSTSKDGYHYYVLFIDDFSRFTWIYPLHQKSELFSKFLLFKSCTENQLIQN